MIGCEKKHETVDFTSSEPKSLFHWRQDEIAKTTNKYLLITIVFAFHFLFSEKLFLLINQLIIAQLTS